MKLRSKFAALSVAVLQSAAQTLPGDSPGRTSWEFNFTADGYLVPGQDGFASPILGADRDWLHLEARYNYENLRTASLGASYNFNAGKTFTLQVTPMIGGVFGRTTGVAAGCEARSHIRKSNSVCQTSSSSTRAIDPPAFTTLGPN